MAPQVNRHAMARSHLGPWCPIFDASKPVEADPLSSPANTVLPRSRSSPKTRTRISINLALRIVNPQVIYITLTVCPPPSVEIPSFSQLVEHCACKDRRQGRWPPPAVTKAVSIPPDSGMASLHNMHPYQRIILLAYSVVVIEPARAGLPIHR